MPDDRSTERFTFQGPLHCPVTITRLAGIPVHIDLGADEEFQIVFEPGDRSMRPLVSLAWDEE